MQGDIHGEAVGDEAADQALPGGAVGFDRTPREFGTNLLGLIPDES
jgi:hypothetical protein